MKTVKFYALIGTVMVAMLFVSCSKDDDKDIEEDLVENQTQISEVEKSDLLKSVEIEKLHSDIYEIMSINNQCDLFSDLCSCDASYTYVFGEILKKYNLENPAITNSKGVYEDTELQEKYNEFLIVSNQELKKLLYFAKGLEEDVLVDLESFMLHVEDNDDILELYLDLKKQTTCQLENIVDRINNKVRSKEHGSPDM